MERYTCVVSFLQFYKYIDDDTVSTIKSPILRNEMRKLAKNSWMRIGLLFIAMNWSLQGCLWQGDRLTLTTMSILLGESELFIVILNHLSAPSTCLLCFSCSSNHIHLLCSSSTLTYQQRGANYPWRRYLLEVTRLVGRGQLLSVKYQLIVGWCQQETKLCSNYCH